MRNKNRSRVLRRVAEQALSKLADGEVLSAERADLATSLVRQWITYDRHAMLFLGEREIYLTLEPQPGGGQVISETRLMDWSRCLTNDLKISPDEFTDLFWQLNRGQSAEVVNTEGVPLRLWVNPKDRSTGVEPLVAQPLPPGQGRDYHKIAVDQVNKLLGSELAPESAEKLASAVALQWKQYDGNASVFVGGQRQFTFTLTEKDGGRCTVTMEPRNFNIGQLLGTLGVPDDAIPDVIERLNLGEKIEYQNREGVPHVLWHDPKAKRIVVQGRKSTPPSAPPQTTPS